MRKAPSALNTTAMVFCLVILGPTLAGAERGRPASRHDALRSAHLTGEWRLVSAADNGFGARGGPALPQCPGGLGLPLAPGKRKSSDEKGAPQPRARVYPREGRGRYEGMIHIPVGPFLMGSAEGEGRLDERPQHRVLVKGFYIGKHEVTAAEYCRFLNERGLTGKSGIPRVKLGAAECPIERNGKIYRPKPGMKELPMACVSWYGARAYARWVGARLPTAAEWEKAAVVLTPHPPGDYLTVLPRKSSVPVRIASPGKAGARGFVGNVWEWCSDWYAPAYYANSPSANPPGPPLGDEKVIRGGSWASAEASRRISNRHKAPPSGRFGTVGFRIVRD